VIAASAAVVARVRAALYRNRGIGLYIKDAREIGFVRELRYTDARLSRRAPRVSKRRQHVPAARVTEH
jgi:hypothetical protein